MQFVEYGHKNKEVIILLHGGGLSWWNYKEVAEALQKKYRVILPILNGHAGSDKAFLSIEDNAKDVIAFIEERFEGHVWAIGGLSLGAQVLVEILSQRKNICRHAIIESASVIPMKLTGCLIRPVFGMSYGLIKQKWFSKWQFQALRIKSELYDNYYEDTCRIKKDDMISFLQANSCYKLKDTLRDTSANAYILVGGKEQRKMILSARKLHEEIKNSEMYILKGLYHGELSLNYAKDYAEMLERLFED